MGHGEPLLKLSRANEACGVKNAATRKYLTMVGTIVTQVARWSWLKRISAQAAVEHARVLREAS
jgi:hypothetical protein